MMFNRGMRQFLFKPFVHILGALAIWIFVVVLMVNEKNDDTSSQLDQLHTYSLKRFPDNYDTVNTQVTATFNDKWTTANDLSCFGLTSFTGQSACKTTRSDLVTTVRKYLGCDIYRSPACNCINQGLRGIANDLTTAGSNKPTGTFSDTAKNMTGRKQITIDQIDNCRYLHHPILIADEPSNSFVRRSHLLFFFSTVVTGNAVYQFVVLPLARMGYFLGWGTFLRLISVLIWPAVGLGTTVGIDVMSSTLVYYITLPPLVLLLWYELLLPPLKHDPYIHPYNFGVLMPLLVVLALVENGVIDYDVITYEVWKSHLLTCLYFGICWFYLFMDGDSDPRKANYLKKPAQETIYITMVLSILVSANTTLAPYPTQQYLNVLWWLPAFFNLLAIGSVVWITDMDRFSDLYYTSGEGNEAEANRRREARADHEKSFFYITNGALYVSAAVMVITLLLLVHYWREYSLVYNAVNQNVPVFSIQSNYSNTWLTPVYT